MEKGDTEMSEEKKSFEDLRSRPEDLLAEELPQPASLETANEVQKGAWIVTCTVSMTMPRGDRPTSPLFISLNHELWVHWNQTSHPHVSACNIAQTLSMPWLFYKEAASSGCDDELAYKTEFGFQHGASEYWKDYSRSENRYRLIEARDGKVKELGHYEGAEFGLDKYPANPKLSDVATPFSTHDDAAKAANMFVSYLMKQGRYFDFALAMKEDPSPYMQTIPLRVGIAELSFEDGCLISNQTQTVHSFI